MTTFSFSLQELLPS